MPLVRLELRNEFGLGNPELFRGAARREDPKAVLDGVAVSGLVGILRQLGDLAGFAAEVFHDLQEQIAAASVRACRMSSRIQHIELSLPSIEEAIQSQTSNIHFAYLPGSDWHANIQLEHDHLLSSDLPQFIMDSYEECRDPPRLFLLDKFDTVGTGSCLKRYSDPTYFKRIWATAEMVDAERVAKEKKAQKRKMQGLQTWNAELRHIVSLARRNNSIQFASSSTDDLSIAAETVSASDIRLKSELESCSTSLDSRAMLSCVEPLPSSLTSIEFGEPVDIDPVQSHLDVENDGYCPSVVSDNAAESNSTSSALPEQNVPHSLAKWAESNLSSTILAKRLLDVEAQSVKDGVYEHGGNDAGFEKTGECMFFEIGNTCTEGVTLFEQDKQDADNEMLNGIFSCKGSRSPRPPLIVTDNSSNYGKPSCHGELSTKLENEGTKGEVPPEHIPGDVQCQLHQGDSTFKQNDWTIRFGSSSKEHSIDLANSYHQDTLSSDSRKEKTFPPVLNQFDEIICETENYADALNAIYSETDTESEQQNVHEPQASSIYDHSIGASSHDAGETPAPHSDYSINDTCLLPQAFQNSVNYSCISSPSKSSPESLLANSPSPEKQFAPNNDLYISQEGIKTDMLKETHAHDQSSSLSFSNAEAILKNDNAVNAPSFNKYQGNYETCVDPSVKIWTNACLFGVEPSKPPDSNVPASIDQKSVLGTAIVRHHPTAGLVSTDSQLDEASMTNNSMSQHNDNITKNPELIEKDNGLHNSSVSSHSGISPSDMLAGGRSNDIKLSTDSVDSSFFDKNHEDMFGNPFLSGRSKSAVVDYSEVENVGDRSTSSSGDRLPTSSLDAQDNDNHRKPMSRLSRLSRSVLSNGLLTANSQRDPLHDAENPPTSSKRLQDGCLPVQQRILPAKVMDQADCETKSTETFEGESSVKFPSSRECKCPSPPSPPLKNMHISFHPINAVANSKLKLEFTGGGFFDESIEELMFPSFQLLSGPSASQQHTSSESDDDTFSLSSFYHPENVFSPRSYSCSESELWKFDGETKLEDMNADENILEAFLPSHIFDLPGLDSIEEKGVRDNVEQYIFPDFMLKQPDEQPPLPPLPPIEWRMARASLPSVEVNRPVKDNLSIKSCSEQVLQAPCNQDEQSPSTMPGLVESLSPTLGNKAMYRSKSMITSHNFNVDNEINAVSAKAPVERVNLLCQTRNKSLPLRRAKTDRPNFIEEPLKNVKVAEMLEKADAIHQAYRGWNEGGDDSWSDSSNPHEKGSTCNTFRD